MKIRCLVFALLLFHLPSILAQKALRDSLFAIAWNKTAAGDVAGAMPLLLRVQKMAEDSNDARALCRIHIMYGKLGLISENNPAVETALAQAEKYCTTCKDTLSLARIAMQRGVLEIKNGRNDSAVVLFKRASDFYLLKQDTMGSVNALAKIGNVLEMENRYADAQAYYLKLYEATKNAPESLEYLTANIYLTGNYHYLGQSEKALFHNGIVKSLAKKMNGDYEYAQALRYEALIFEQMGQYETAFGKLNDYMHYYQDTLMREESLRQAEELKVKYEAEKKEAQIALQNAELARARFRFWAVIAGLALALIAGGFLFLLARRLRKRNREKEFLIREIHHRVKNNLQILSSLLHLQSRQITDDTALDAVREGQNRVDAMGLIHQKLYMGDNVARVEMKEYLEQFGQNMLDSFGIDDGRVTLHYEVQPMYLDVDTAIPLGLIINELVTNSFKYAFPEGRRGTINIALWNDEKQRLCLKVTDNGVGQAYVHENQKSTSFGTNLVQMLSKKLKGKPELLVQEKGYGTLIVFEG